MLDIKLHPGTATDVITAMCLPTGPAVHEPSASPAAVSTDDVVLCNPGAVVKKPPGNSVKRFHNLRNLGGVKFYDAIQVTAPPSVRVRQASAVSWHMSCLRSERLNQSLQIVILRLGDTLVSVATLSCNDASAAFACRSPSTGTTFTAALAAVPEASFCTRATLMMAITSSAMPVSSCKDLLTVGTSR